MLKAGKLVASICCAIAAVLVVQVSSAAAAAGELDRSFGGTGVIELTPGPSGETAIGFAVGPHSESLVLEKGFVCKGDGYGISGCGARFFLSRYAANGSRDVAFGERARVAALEVGDANQGASVAVDRQGRPMLAALNQGQLEVVRLLSNGERDPSFGTGGKVERICGCESSTADIAVDGSERIVVRLRSERVTRLIRFLPSGRLDSGFGGKGEVSLEAGSSAPGTWALRDGGQIVLADLGCCGPKGAALRLVRVSSKGVVDKRFGFRAEQTISRLDLVKENRPRSASTLLPRSNGSFYLLGETQGGGFVLRLGAGGTLDRHFGKRGIKAMPWAVQDAAFDGRGRIVGVGEVPREYATVVFRLQPNGARDRGFGDGFAVELPRLHGEAKPQIAVGPNQRPVVFNSGLSYCRQFCGAQPELLRLLGGSRGA